MKRALNLHDVYLNYNPEAPQERFKAAGLAAALVKQASARLPATVPWPAGKAPAAAPLANAPAETDDLAKFKGYDAVVVTYTAAEAATLAALFTPGHQTINWYEYRHNIAAYLPLVTGSMAPFNSTDKEDARYYHSLGLYFPCTIGNAKVLVFKSGLHLDYDGPATPVARLMAEIAAAVQPKIFVTTGTGGGIGTDVQLGDVVIAGQTHFYCPSGGVFTGQEQFSDPTKFPWNADSYNTSPFPAPALAAITPALTKVNAAKVPNARPEPKIWSASTDTIVTTDFFGFDDSTNYYGLQTSVKNGTPRACDMGDAMVGHALKAQVQAGLKWYAIRNASDPQIPNPNNNIKAADQKATEIYSKYGAFTTAASVIATWALIDALINENPAHRSQATQKQPRNHASPMKKNTPTIHSYLKKRKKPYFTNLAAIPNGGLTPAQVCAAYQFKKVKPIRPVKIGIVSLGGFYSASDMTTAFKAYKLPAPTVTVAGPQIKTDKDSTDENMLDIECTGAAWAYATGQAAVLMEQFETNDGNGIPNAINALVAAGCEVISISWGGPADEQPASSIAARKKACAAAAAANVHVFAASGDESLDDGTNSRTPNDPCCDPNVWGVGGTRLQLNADGSIALESAWGDGNSADEGGGGGFDPKEPMPAYQKGVVPGKKRGCPDSSANADPQSGYAIFANGSWQIVGGTSASTPLTAGYVAAILSTLKGPISQVQLQTTLYTHYKTAFNEITTGSDGAPAKAGWNEATGCGSINGPGMAAALT